LQRSSSQSTPAREAAVQVAALEKALEHIHFDGAAHAA
jgi:hypothetical protein